MTRFRIRRLNQKGEEMRINTKDETLKKNYIQKYQFLISEYEEVKQGLHKRYKKVGEFYEAHGTCRQTFLRYYGRYKNSKDPSSLLPGKRGPKYQTRRTDSSIEELVLSERSKGCNKYEINAILAPKLGARVPSPSCIYNIFKRHGVNKLKIKEKEEKRRIIKEKAGELGHVDCHHLSRDTITGDKKKYYLVCVIDSCTRVAWAELVDDIKSLSVMFSTLHCLNYIASDYNIKFAELLTDNGPEFGPRNSQNKKQHPFERMLLEIGIRYTRPYRPQTNGKVERFWRTLNEDLIDGTYFESIEHFKKELHNYLLYYNKLRPHQGLNGNTPYNFNQSCQRIT
jgi:transposase InsO family protein